MKLNVSLLALLGLAVSATPPAQAVTPAAPPATSSKASIDTRLYWDAQGSPQGEIVDTRLYLLIRSLLDAKIDTLTKPGTLLLLK